MAGKYKRYTKSGQSGESTVKRDPLKLRTKIGVTGLFWEEHSQTLPYEEQRSVKSRATEGLGLFMRYCKNST